MLVSSCSHIPCVDGGLCWFDGGSSWARRTCRRRAFERCVRRCWWVNDRVTFVAFCSNCHPPTPLPPGRWRVVAVLPWGPSDTMVPGWQFQRQRCLRADAPHRDDTPTTCPPTPYRCRIVVKRVSCECHRGSQPAGAVDARALVPVVKQLHPLCSHHCPATRHRSHHPCSLPRCSCIRK